MNNHLSFPMPPPRQPQVGVFFSEFLCVKWAGQAAGFKEWIPPTRARIIASRYGLQGSSRLVAGKKKGSVVPPSVFFCQPPTLLPPSSPSRFAIMRAGWPKGGGHTSPRFRALLCPVLGHFAPALGPFAPLPPLQASCLSLQWLRLGQKSLRWGQNALRSWQPRAPASHACVRPPLASPHPRCGVGCLPPALPICVGFSASLGVTCGRRGGGMVPVNQTIGKNLLIFYGLRSSVC